jgi:hypothetical protein
LRLEPFSYHGEPKADLDGVGVFLWNIGGTLRDFSIGLIGVVKGAIIDGGLESWNKAI